MKPSTRLTYFLSLLLVSAGYFIAGKFGLMLASIHPSASPLWAPTGIALAACLCLGYRIWPAIALAAFFVNITTAGSVASSLGIAAGNTLEGLFGAFLVNHFAGGRNAFDRPRDVLTYMVLAGFLSTIISPTLGVTSLALWGYAPWVSFGPIWLTWWLGDVGGALIAAPFLILWSRKPEQPWNRGELLEATFLLFSLIYLGLVVFDALIFPGSERYPLEFLCIPPVIWTAYRFGPRETATASVLLSGFAVWGTLHGYGPFARSSPNESLLLMQTFLGVMSVMGLILAALVAERHQGVKTLQRSNEALEKSVEERTLSLSRIVADLRAEVLQRKEMEKTLRDSQERFRLLVEAVEDYAIYMLDPQGKVISWNAGAERLKGYKADEILGRHFSVFYTKKDIEQGTPERELETAIARGHVEDAGLRLRKDGTTFWADAVITALRDKQGQLRGFVKITRDVTERRKAEAALNESEERFRQLLQANIIGFMRLDKTGRVLEANDAILHLLGYTQEHLAAPGLDQKTLTPSQFHSIDQWMQDRLRASGRCPPIEKEFIRKDGCRIPVLVGMVLLSGTDGQRLCFVIDVTERRAAQDALRKAYDELEVRVQQRTTELQEEVLRRQHAEEELRNQAIRDPLTGLYNRRGFMTMTDPYQQLAERQKKPMLLFMADLDDLKVINDTFGHVEGDQALMKAAELLRNSFRQSDLIARIGGDEFAVAGMEEPGQSANDLSGRLEQTVDDYNRYSGKPYRIRLSMGTARIDPGGKVNLEELMKQADAMLYEQKKLKSPSLLKAPPR